MIQIISLTLKKDLRFFLTAEVMKQARLSAELGEILEGLSVILGL